MINKGKILVVGSANTDMVISADHFPLPGETLMGTGFMTNFGGKGANQAVAVARLGGDTAFIGKVGKDSLGAAIKKHLTEEGMNTSCLYDDKDEPTGVALITTIPQGENTIIVNSGANAHLKAKDIQAAEELFAQASIVLMQMETPTETLTEAAKLAKKYGAYVIFNPAPAPKEPLPQELLENIDLLIPNETEASSISRIEIINKDSAQKAISEIKKQGVKDIIITIGDKGTIAEFDRELIEIPAFKVKAIDTTAAGDTFCGALCVALSEGQGIKNAILFASKAASITVTKKGAQQSIPFRKEVELS